MVDRQQGERMEERPREPGGRAEIARRELAEEKIEEQRAVARGGGHEARPGGHHCRIGGDIVGMRPSCPQNSKRRPGRETAKAAGRWRTGIRTAC